MRGHKDNKEMPNGGNDNKTDGTGPIWAAWFGSILLLFTAGITSAAFWYAFLHSQTQINASGGSPFTATLAPAGLGVLAGFALLALTFAGLVLLFRSLRLTDPQAALGLPAGSIRALLALGLVIVFVSVATWILILRDPDTTKQILTISATALTTIVGFYFGSNASSDAARTIAAITGLANGNGDGGAKPATPPDPKVLAQKVSTIQATAEAAKRRLTELSDPSLDTLKAEAGAAQPTVLDQAVEAFQQMTTKYSACATDADRAGDALKSAQQPGADAKILSDAAARIDQLTADSTAANHDFQTAAASFVAARDALLKSVAKG
jgi:hypothetical protein